MAGRGGGGRNARRHATCKKIDVLWIDGRRVLGAGDRLTDTTRAHTHVALTHTTPFPFCFLCFCAVLGVLCSVCCARGAAWGAVLGVLCFSRAVRGVLCFSCFLRACPAVRLGRLCLRSVRLWLRCIRPGGRALRLWRGRLRQAWPSIPAAVCRGIRAVLLSLAAHTHPNATQTPSDISSVAWRAVQLPHPVLCQTCIVCPSHRRPCPCPFEPLADTHRRMSTGSCRPADG